MLSSKTHSDVLHPPSPPENNMAFTILITLSNLHLSIWMNYFIQSDLQCIQAIHVIRTCISLGIETVTLAMLCQSSYSSTYQLSANLHKANEVGIDICLMALEITRHLSNLYYECYNLCLITNKPPQPAQCV